MSDKQKNQQLDDLVNQSRIFEKDIIDNLNKSKKLAWFVTIIFIIYSLGLTGVLIVLIPLKEVQPYVIRVDNNTGYTDIVPSLTDTNFTPEDALDRFWVAHYIQTREKYVYETLQQDYELTQVFGSQGVNRQYISFFSSPNAPHKLYGSNFTIAVKILSINLGTSDGETATKTAIARAELTKTNLDTNDKSSKRIFLTIAYEYKPQLALSSQQRHQNPLGFQILSYTSDTEIAGN